jgi:hypothetical protein
MLRSGRNGKQPLYRGLSGRVVAKLKTIVSQTTANILERRWTLCDTCGRKISMLCCVMARVAMPSWFVQAAGIAGSSPAMTVICWG